ncbi:MAG: hypothetical protein E6I85_01980 [Chloroflexi bacterium]|nr:MAG: hypothetical protein E6I85_01980 [Chloroflexota bacterium]
MRSTDRRAAQRGIALVEAVVALALLAIGVTVGLTGIETASAGAKEMVNRGRAQCMVRSESQYVALAPYVQPGAGRYAAPAQDRHGYLTAVPSAAVDASGTPLPGVESVTINYFDSATNSPVVQPVLMVKSQALSGGSAGVGQVGAGC